MCLENNVMGSAVTQQVAEQLHAEMTQRSNLNDV